MVWALFRQTVIIDILGGMGGNLRRRLPDPPFAGYHAKVLQRFANVVLGWTPV